MRRLLAVPFLIAALLGSGAVLAALQAPPALAAGGTATTAGSSTATSSGTSTGASAGSNLLPNSSLDLSNAAQNAAAGNTTTAVPVTSSTSSSGGISGSDAILIAVIAVLLLGGIAFFVWRDSRRHAAQIGHDHEEPMYGARSHPGSKTPHRPRKLKPAERKRRKRGKAR